MIKTTLNSSDSSPTPEPGAIDSLWQPSWLQWLVAALSGTVETEKQIAWLKKSTAELKKRNAELKKSNAELKKSNAELKKSNAEWLSNEQRTIEELRKENDRLAEIESKLDAILQRSNTNLTPAKLTDKP
jgi:predicted nuclease with TOPRIM domain